MFWLFDSIFSGEVRPCADYAVDDAQVQRMLAYMRDVCGPQPPRTRKPRTPRARPPAPAAPAPHDDSMTDNEASGGQ